MPKITIESTEISEELSVALSSTNGLRNLEKLLKDDVERKEKKQKLSTNEHNAPIVIFNTKIVTDTNKVVDLQECVREACNKQAGPETLNKLWNNASERESLINILLDMHLPVDVLERCHPDIQTEFAKKVYKQYTNL